MFGRRDAPEGAVIGGIALDIREAGDDIYVNARCRKSELKYLIQIITERLGAIEEEPAGPARPRLRRHRH
jgi:hypothetical protein